MDDLRWPRHEPAGVSSTRTRYWAGAWYGLVDEPACPADKFHMAALNLCGDHFGDLVGELVNRVELPSGFAAGLNGAGVQTVE